MTDKTWACAQGAVLMLLMWAGCAPAMAEGSIEISTERFAPPAAPKSLPFAPAPVKPAAVASAPKRAAPPAPPPQPIWQVKAGSLLSETLHDWAKVSGWAVVWRLSDKEDFRLDASDRYQGDFKGAISNLFNSLPASVRLHASLVPDNVPPLLYVTREESGNH